MSHGTDLITKTSSLDEELRLKLLEHPYFQATGDAKSLFDLQDHFINETPDDYDKLVLELLKREQYDYSDSVIEYWFQKHTPGPGLRAHCDYNFIYRKKMQLEGDDWPHIVNKDHIVSPITIAVYLEMNDLIGGEIGISHRTWYEDPLPTSHLTLSNIKQHPYILYAPRQGSVIYFRGSENYHWIEPIKQGSRKSMLINFWPKELLDK